MLRVKKFLPQLGDDPLPFACEASALYIGILFTTTTGPGGSVVTSALGSVPTQYFLLLFFLCLNTFPHFFLSFSFLFFILSSPSPLPFLFLSFCFVDVTFLISFLPSPPSLFFLFSLPPFYLVCLTYHLKCPATFEHGRIFVLALRKLI